jgi:Cytochrome c554 and c-prime
VSERPVGTVPPLAPQESRMAETMARDESNNPEARSVSARRARRITVLTLAAVAGCAVWVVFTASPPGTSTDRARGVRLLTLDRAFPPGGRYPSDPYVGPRVCRECHPGESALHARSGHARTLRPAGRRALKLGLDGKTIDDPELPGVSWSYRYRDGQLHIARQTSEQVEECVVEYAFGSGQHATTFVNVIDPKVPAILEHRITYYTRQHALGLTPGQRAELDAPGRTPIGAVFESRQARKCFGCHATQVSLDGRKLDESTLIPDVSCERCHGPARAHVEAARRGAADSELELPFGTGRYTPERLLMLCGTCHRHPSRGRPEQIRPDDPQLARFQPVGIIASRCFRESRGAFSCVTCHDPHARASTDRRAYLAVCLSCHSGGPKSDPSATAGTPCPVVPRGDCIDCHMPRVDAGQHVLFADHWIRVRRPGERVQRPGPPPNLKLLDAPDP